MTLKRSFSMQEQIRADRGRPSASFEQRVPVADYLAARGRIRPRLPHRIAIERRITQVARLCAPFPTKWMSPIVECDGTFYDCYVPFALGRDDYRGTSARHGPAGGTQLRTLNPDDTAQCAQLGGAGRRFNGTVLSGKWTARRLIVPCDRAMLNERHQDRTRACISMRSPPMRWQPFEPKEFLYRLSKWRGIQASAIISGAAIWCSHCDEGSWQPAFGASRQLGIKAGRPHFGGPRMDNRPGRLYLYYAEPWGLQP